jgi:hypothetical protein
MARPMELTDEVQVALAKALERLPIRYACDLVGIDQKTYRNWMDRAEAGEEPFLSFSRLARKGRAGYLANRLGVIHDAAGEDWKAAAWYVERNFKHFQPRAGKAAGASKRQAIDVDLGADGNDPGAADEQDATPD